MTSELDTERFISLFLSHRHAICAMIAAVVPNAADADDVLQETSARMWRNFDKFQAGTNFVAWAAAFVRFSAMNHYRKQRANRGVTFSDELVALVASETATASESIDSRREALRDCLKRLPQKSRQLIEMRYEPGTTMRQMAERLGRSSDSVYKAVSRRIRRWSAAFRNRWRAGGTRDGRFRSIRVERAALTRSGGRGFGRAAEAAY